MLIKNAPKVPVPVGIDVSIGVFLTVPDWDLLAIRSRGCYYAYYPHETNDDEEEE